MSFFDALFERLVLLACATLILAEPEKKADAKTSDKTPITDIRDKRNLEYSLTLPNSHVASYRQKDTSTRQSSARLLRRSWNPESTPPYAVKMEPLPHYSQRDPLYESRYAAFAPPMDQYGEGNHIDTQYFINSIQRTLNRHHGRQHNHHHQPRPQYGQGGHYPHYYEEPEPIIEIIIKESNETLPAPPAQVVQPTKKPREPVQVFYVKYEKDAHSKDGVKYDTPIPALTPHPPTEEAPYEESTHPPEPLPTLPPPPSTTLRTIIHPDSERYHSESGIRVSFGAHDESHHHKSHTEEHEESAPEPRVVFPHPSQQSLAPIPTVSHYKFDAFQKAPLRPVLPPPPPHFIKRQQGNSPLTYQTQNYQNFQQTFDQKTQHLQHFSNRQQLPLPQPPQNFRTPHQFQGPALPNFFGSFQSRQVPPTGPQNYRPVPPTGPNFQRLPPSSNFPSHQQLPLPQQRVPFTQSRFQQPYHTISQQRLEYEQRQQDQRLKEQHEREESRLQELRLKEQRQRELRQQESREQELRQHEQKEREFREQERRQQEQRIRDLQLAHEIKVQEQERINAREREQRLQEEQRLHELRQYEQRQQQEQRQEHDFHQQHSFRQQPLQRPLPSSPALPFAGPSQAPAHQFHSQQSHNIQGHSLQHQHAQQLLPPGGELVMSIPKFEQHLSVPAEVANPLLTHGFPSPPPSQPSQQLSHQSFGQSQLANSQQIIAQPSGVGLSPNQFRQQIQQQFNYDAIRNYSPQPVQPLQTQQQSQLSTQLQPQLSTQLQPQSQPQQSTHLQPQFPTHLQPQLQPPIRSQQRPLQQRPVQQHTLFVTPPSHLFENDHSEPKDNTLHNNYQQQLHRPQISANSQTINPVIQLEPRQPHSQHHDDSSFNRYLESQSNYETTYQSTSPSTLTSHTTKFISSVSRSYSTTPAPTTIVSTTTPKPEPTTAKKPLDIELPDEVPDELRQQLLSSGILDHASISVLDYDKVGDIPIESLPPDQLANFYGAGGASQIASSNRVQTVVTKEGKKIQQDLDTDSEAQASEIIRSYSDLKKLSSNKKQKVEMKVVQFDPNTRKGQSVANSYIRKDATYLEPVNINDSKFNRYLPLKVSGSHFPIPDAPELKGRMVTSVVVLAPVDTEYLRKTDNENLETGRFERAIQGEAEGARYLAGEALKQLVKKPSRSNFRRWLDKESGTAPESQAVVLLVTGTEDSNGTKDKEIFIYDLSSKTVSKLNGELSTSFVEVAETNSKNQNLETAPIESSEETTTEPNMEEPEDEEAEESQVHEVRVPFPSDQEEDLETGASDIFEQFVDVSGLSIDRRDPYVSPADLIMSPSELHAVRSGKENVVLISSGYSRTSGSH